jgi:purine-cytosine permease-like protein
MNATSGGRQRQVIETRSIDYVPVTERHGKVWHQGPFWFTGNFVLVMMVTGFLGPVVGLSLGYACLAIVLGVCFGTFSWRSTPTKARPWGYPR